MKYNYNGLSTPLFPLASRWRLYFNCRLFDILPIRAERRSAALLETLHHRTPRVIVGVCENLLEKRIDGAIATDVGILLHGLFLIAGEDIRSDTLPVLSLVGDRDFRRGRRDVTCEC